MRKVTLTTENGEGESPDIECPWADYLGNDQYRLKNFPFFFYGLSYDDIFVAKPISADDNMPHFERVIKKSGHKTVRIIFSESIKTSEESRKILSDLTDFGCGYEGTNGEVYFVINIQPHCDFWKICEYLTEMNVKWEHADPTYKELYPKESKT